MKRILSNPILSLYPYPRVPIWNELAKRTKLEITALVLWQERCVAFTVNLHPEYEAKLLASGADISDRIRRRVNEELEAIGLGNTYRLLCVEDRGRAKERVRPHFHGLIRLEDATKDEVLKDALRRAGGHGVGKRLKESRAVVIEPVYDALGWVRYFFKNGGKLWNSGPKRGLTVSRGTTQLARITYELMTGAASAASFVSSVFLVFRYVYPHSIYRR